MCFPCVRMTDQSNIYMECAHSHGTCTWYSECVRMSLVAAGHRTTTLQDDVRAYNRSRCSRVGFNICLISNSAISQHASLCVQNLKEMHVLDVYNCENGMVLTFLFREHLGSLHPCMLKGCNSEPELGE